MHKHAHADIDNSTFEKDMLRWVAQGAGDEILHVAAQDAFDGTQWVFDIWCADGTWRCILRAQGNEDGEGRYWHYEVLDCLLTDLWNLAYARNRCLEELFENGDDADSNMVERGSEYWGC